MYLLVCRDESIVLLGDLLQLLTNSIHGFEVAAVSLLLRGFLLLCHFLDGFLKINNGFDVELWNWDAVKASGDLGDASSQLVEFYTRILSEVPQRSVLYSRAYHWK